MKELVKDDAIDLANLLALFSFDLDGSRPEQLVGYWLSRYPTQWVQFAVVEALYQGRYKAWSIEQILAMWRRRGRPVYHFNHEFERIVRGRFSRHLLMQPQNRPLNVQPRSQTTRQMVTAQPSPASLLEPPKPNVKNLRPEELLSEELHSEELHSEALCSEELQSEALYSEELYSEALYSEELHSEALSPEELHSEELHSDQCSSSAAEDSSSENGLQLLSLAESIAFLDLHSSESSAQSAAKELPIQAFRPIVVFESDTITKMKELALEASRSPVEEIQQFVPTAIPSDFYSKLKAVATERSAPSAKDE
jgi:hypothetical protein